MYGFVLGQNLILGQQNATFHQSDLNSPIARKHIAAQVSFSPFLICRMYNWAANMFNK
jgi:hypothetical protein